MDKLAVGYVRRSSEEEGVGSLDMQKEHIEKYVERNGYKLIKVYEEKKFASDKMEGDILDMTVRDYINQRPIFKQLLEELQPLTTILVWRWDRLARSAWTSQLIQVVESRGCKCLSITEGDHPLTRDILSAIARGEIETNKARIHAGRMRMLEKGLWIHQAPFGYKKIKHEQGIKTVKEEFEICKEIFRLSLLDKSQAQIKEEIYNKFEKEMSAEKIGQMLQLEVYAGRCQYKGKVYECKHEKVVSWEEFEKIQHMRKTRRVRTPMYRKKKSQSISPSSSGLNINVLNS